MNATRFFYHLGQLPVPAQVQLATLMVERVVMHNRTKEKTLTYHAEIPALLQQLRQLELIDGRWNDAAIAEIVPTTRTLRSLSPHILHENASIYSQYALYALLDLGELAGALQGGLHHPLLCRCVEYAIKVNPLDMESVWGPIMDAMLAQWGVNLS